MNVRIAAVGDIALADHYLSLGHGTGAVVAEHGCEGIFCEIKSSFTGADIVFGNLETPIAPHSQFSVGTSHDSVAFRAPRRVIAELARIGFNVLNVANNHILQHGLDAFWETVGEMRRVGIEPLGLVDDTREYYSLPVRVATDSTVTMLFGYSGVQEQHAPEAHVYARMDVGRISLDVQMAMRQADYVIVSLHGGTEGGNLPSPDLISVVRQLVTMGASAVFCHHSHVFQPYEIYQSGVALYSLGDCVFDLFWDKRYTESAIARIVLSRLEEPNVTLIPISYSKFHILEHMKDSRRRSFDARIAAGSKALTASRSAYCQIYIEDFDRHSRFLQVRKLLYLLRTLLRGSIRLKFRFLFGKVISRLPTWKD